MENNTSFYRKQHVVFRRHFCSIRKTLKLGARYEKLKTTSYFARHNRKTKKKYKFFIEIFGSSKKHFIFAISTYQSSRYSLSKSYS